jgi:hypothetical protein
MPRFRGSVNKGPGFCPESRTHRCRLHRYQRRNERLIFRVWAGADTRLHLITHRGRSTDGIETIHPSPPSFRMSLVCRRLPRENSPLKSSRRSSRSTWRRASPSPASPFSALDDLSPAWCTTLRLNMIDLDVSVLPASSCGDEPSES